MHYLRERIIIYCREDDLVRLFFTFVFLIFSFLSIQSQAQVLIKQSISENMDLFDWQAFIDKENIQKNIGFRNQGFNLFGANINILDRLNFDKLDLVQLEKELELYKQGVKRALSSEDIQRAEEAIKLYRDNIEIIENAILEQGFKAGFITEATPTAQAYRKAIQELYQTDHEIVFNLVEKTDKRLFSALGANDEAYAKLILPQVDQYAKKMGKITQSYYDSLWSADQNQDLSVKNMDHLIDTHSSSLQIYNCFKKNFKNPVGEHQIALMNTIGNWYGQQSALGAKGLIEAYTKGIVSNPWFVVSKLHRFTSAPQGVKVMIAEFYRKDILNNKDFINTDEQRKLGARVDALLGLKYLGFLNNEEQQLFDRALSAGVIEKVGKGNYFSGSSRPLP